MEKSYKAQYDENASARLKFQACAPVDGLSVQSDGKQGASHLGGQVAYAATGDFSGAHQQHFNLRPQDQQQGQVSE